MRKEFLGRGWRFPFQVDSATGGVAYSEFEENIRDCIALIIGTKPGERQMMPEFGCSVHEMMFAPNTHATADQIAHLITVALNRWEPRIVVNRVESHSDTTGTVRVAIHYTIRSTQSLQELSLLLNPSG